MKEAAPNDHNPSIAPPRRTTVGLVLVVTLAAACALSIVLNVANWPTATAADAPQAGARVDAPRPAPDALDDETLRLREEALGRFFH